MIKNKITTVVLTATFAACLCLTASCFKIYRDVQSFLGWLIVLLLCDAVLAFAIYVKYKQNDERLPLNLRQLAIVFAISIFLAGVSCNYATSFSFDKWQNKSYLRKFMISQLIKLQSFGSTEDEGYLSKYTPAEVEKAMLNENDLKMIPDVTVGVYETYKDMFYPRIYYAYTSLLGKDYWLVIVYSVSNSDEKAIVSEVLLLPSGTDFALGKPADF